MGCDMKKTVFIVFLAGIVMLCGCNKSEKKDSSITSSNSSSEATKLESSSIVDSSSQLDLNTITPNEAETAYWSTFYGSNEAIAIEKKKLQAEKDFSDQKISHADVRAISDQCMNDYGALAIIYEKRIRSELSGDNLATFNSYMIEREKADNLRVETQKKLEQYANFYGNIYNSQLEYVEYELAKSKAIDICLFYNMILTKKEYEKKYKPYT